MKEKFSSLSRILFAMTAALIMLGANKEMASAKIIQTEIAGDSVTIQWDNQTSSEYYIGYSTDVKDGRDLAKAMATEKKIAVPKTQKSYKITGLQPGQKVYVSLGTTTYWPRQNRTDFNTLSSDFCTLPGQVTGLNQQKWYRLNKSLYVGWNKQSGVSGYEYVLKDSKGHVIQQNTQLSDNFCYNGVDNSKIYTCEVRAYTKATVNGQENTYYSDWTPSCYCMTQPGAKPYRGNVSLGLDLKLSGGKLTVKWEKVDGITGYNVYVATKKGGSFTKVKSLNANKTKATIKKIGKKKIKGSKKYYVYVEGYKTVNGNTYTTGLNYITQTNGSRSTINNVIYENSWNN